MIREDIKINISKASVTILTKNNQVTFSAKGTLVVFTTANFTMPMLDELEKSKILRVDGYSYSGESGTIRIKKEFGFDNEKFIDLLIYLIEKYEL